MKARSRLEGPSTLAAHGKEFVSQDRILQQIQAITREIEGLQTEIYGRVQPMATGAWKKRSAAANPAEARVLAQFKVSLDRLRHVLWFYIEQLASRSGHIHLQSDPVATEHRSQTDREQSPSTERESAGPPPGSFFDRLDMVIDSYVKLRPSAANLRKRPKT